MTRTDNSWRFVVDVLPAILYVAGVFYGGSIPLKAPPIAEGLPFDKFLHLVVFGGMQVVLVRLARFQFPAWGFERQNLAALAGASGLGLMLEIHQAMLPHRSAEFFDWLADTAGAVLAALILRAGARKLFLPAGRRSETETG